MSGDDLLTAREAARLCGVGVGCVREWARNGHLPVAEVRKNGLMTAAVYRLADVRRCAAERRTSRGGRPRDTGAMTAEELDAFVAERMQSLPDWWSVESAKAPKEVARTLRERAWRASVLRRGRR